MERVHKANLLVILACVLALSVTTIMSYGMYCRGGFPHAAFLVAYRYGFTVWHFAFPPSC